MTTLGKVSVETKGAKFQLPPESATSQQKRVI